MKIGIASNDRQSIAQHFGRTAGFVIIDLEDGKESSRHYRENTFSNHNQKSELHMGGHAHGEHNHSHTAIIDALSDCSLVISRGMGRRIYEDLHEANIKAIITDLTDVDEALVSYMQGTLIDNPEKGCTH